MRPAQPLLPDACPVSDYREGSRGALASGSAFSLSAHEHARMRTDTCTRTRGTRTHAHAHRPHTPLNLIHHFFWLLQSQGNFLRRPQRGRYPRPAGRPAAHPARWTGKRTAKCPDRTRAGTAGPGRATRARWPGPTAGPRGAERPPLHSARPPGQAERNQRVAPPMVSLLLHRVRPPCLGAGAPPPAHRT